MRGKGFFSDEIVSDKRITPAYAGKSCCAAKASKKSKDHPRLCGEKPDGYYKAKDITGSPPPMRGKGS